MKILTQLTKNGKIPVKQHESDYAFDMYTTKDVLVMQGELSAVKVPLGIKTEFDSEHYGMIIAPRSSFSKLPLSLPNSFGIVEGSYRGEWLLTLRNTMSMAGTSSKVLTLGKDGKVKEASLSSVSPRAISDAKRRFEDDNKVLNMVTPKRVENSLFSSVVPAATVYIEAGTRLVQTYAVKKEPIEFVETSVLHESERGSGSFGSTGTK